MKITIGNNGETIMEAEDEVLRVEFAYIGEGRCGDYNAKDPDDEKLIRFYVYIKDKYGWAEVEDTSYCTYIPVDTDPKQMKTLLETVFKEYRNVVDDIKNGSSVKKLGERLSWLGSDGV